MKCRKSKGGAGKRPALAYRIHRGKALKGIASFAGEMHPLLEIIFEDADLLVVHKPADLVCHPTKERPLLEFD